MHNFTPKLSEKMTKMKDVSLYSCDFWIVSFKVDDRSNPTVESQK